MSGYSGFIPKGGEASVSGVKSIAPGAKYGSFVSDVPISRTAQELLILWIGEWGRSFRASI